MKNCFQGALAGILFLGACAAPQTAKAPVPSIAGLDGSRCSGGTISIDTAFPAGALQSCTIDASGNAIVRIAPEDAPPINCSPWYAFRVTPTRPTKVSIKLNYAACGHRYRPKYSFDGISWEYIDPKNVHIGEFGGVENARFEIESDGRAMFVAAQEIMVPSTYRAWLDRLGPLGGQNRQLLGKSAEGRDIELVRIGNPDAREVVALVGRQHPPEVTGALAMVAFVEELLANDELARRFRERFQVVAVPLLNPDGVVRGHWRHNTGGVDLNRDWGPFTQPETRLMRDLLEAVDADPAQTLRLFIDFHSTRYDTIYTLTDDQMTNPAGYKDAWLNHYAANLPGYDVSVEPGHNPDFPVSKAWVFTRFGVPTATYEIGDETDRVLIGKLGKQAARSMMETMLETTAP